MIEALGNLFQFESRSEIATICRDVTAWTQNLRPRDLKPSVYSLLSFAKVMLDEAQVSKLMDQVNSFVDENEDVYGNVRAYAEWLECFFMEKLSSPLEKPFASQKKKVQRVAADTDYWTIQHDIATMVLHFNSLRDEEIDDNDKFNFQQHLPEMLNIVVRGRIGEDRVLPVDILPLLEEVDSVLFPPTGKAISFMPRVAKSHENLVRAVNPSGIFQSEMKEILFGIYKTTLATLYLTHEQKMEFKRWLLFWHQTMDLSNLILVVDYSYDAGREVLGAIDYPQKLETRGRSLERFCLE